MAVDLENLDLSRKPDPNFKADPAARGDFVDDAAPEEDLEEETPEPEAKKAEEPKKPAKKAAEEKNGKEVENEATKDDEADEEDEDPVEDEDEDEEDEEDEEEQRLKGKKVPYKRFAAKVKQTEEALERLATLEKENQSLRDLQTEKEKKETDALQAEMEGLYEKIEEQRALGEYKEAAKLQRKLDDLRGSMSRAETVLLSRQAAVAQQQVNVFNTALSQIEAAFPELSSKHKSFDRETLIALDETIRGYEAMGDSPPDALRKASRRILRYDPFAKEADAYLPGHPKLQKAPEPEKKVTERKTDIKKNLEANKKQPPDPVDDNNDIETKIDVKKLRPEEWAKLPQAMRERLRGDKLKSS